MDFKKLLTVPASAVGALVGAGQPGPTDEQQMIAKMLAGGADSVSKFDPAPPSTPFNLPGLDDSLTPDAQKRKAAAEAQGQTFTPGENDYNDSGPYGYMHKKSIHDALMSLHSELQANTPHIDYEGILKSKLADLAQMPAEHHTNPLMLMAMAMGNPEHANEMIQTHNKIESEANARQNSRWQELLDLKQQALEGSIKQALAEGDQRKIISGKWLDQLAQIEQDKAKLGGELQKGQQKDAAAIARANLRGQWALKAVEQRTAGILTSSGIKQGSADFRAIQGNAKSLAERLIKNGTEPEDAYNQAEDWAIEQVNQHSTAGAGVGGGGRASTPAASGAGATNPLQARIQANRNKNTPTPTKP